nr:MAG TPA: DNA primase small subunit PriS, DNA-dependent RNA polymerase, DNA [Caudoviricetes sp.]
MSEDRIQYPASHPGHYPDETTAGYINDLQ